MSEESLQRKADRVKLKSRKSVMSYMVILFAAAFVLLVMAYVMQQRSNEQAIDGLKDSISTMQNAQEVYEENAALKDQLSELEDKLSAAQTALTQTQAERDNLKDLLIVREQTLSLTQLAMDYFWQVNEAYVRGRYTLARSLIQIMEGEPAAVMEGAPHGSPIRDYLPTTSTTSNDRFSPYDRYQEIYEALY